MHRLIPFLSLLIMLFDIAAEDAVKSDPRAEFIREHYAKYEYEIPMRDGKTLFTAVYVPYDDSRTYPMLMLRTPYSVAPYGINNYRKSLAPSSEFEKEKFIFVWQDVRGRFRSEGEFVNMRPQNAYQRGGQAVDDATDTYDTIEWLVKNIPNNNGRVGMWGVSYPGYYASVGSINAHDALKAISPQAPIADWFFDDFHRNGMFALPMAFVFFDRFDNFPKDKHNFWPEGLDLPTHDGYDFFLELGSLANVNKVYFKNERPFWNDLVAHPNYDDYWKQRNVLQHLNDTEPATLVVGGWYDTEDLYGPLQTYKTMSRKNKEDHVKLVMGPWSHGQWNGEDTDNLGEAEFGFQTGEWFQENVLLPFFSQHLKGKDAKIATATMFETGANRWRRFDQWPPKNTKSLSLFFAEKESLLSEPQDKQEPFTEYLSDPHNPVPHSKKIGRGWDRPYMVEDQRFADRRPDVVSFDTEPLKNDLTLAGDIKVDLYVSTDKTAADFVVKLVDVFPGKDPNTGKLDKKNGNRHELVRWGAIRGRFRDSMSNPIPFKPNEITRVSFELYDVLHTIKRGHKLKIMVQSSMFPFLDRNPQTYVDNIFYAKDSDFVKANHRIYHDGKHNSKVVLSVLD
ncbi:CocE/NonD family hydrolase [Pleionea sediminis]|uniref:CocE/NonD family hydrolase n=1 Tax=Pleionea sediminis TaxID=2569479 RepID=UPI0011861DD6|nr:CocE/NonD family hydrolase [Pleionea sediminis]